MTSRLPHDAHPSVVRAPEPPLGSALTPLTREAAWVAYQVASADPTHCSPAIADTLSARVRRFAWGAWLPGRSAIITEVEVAPDRGALDGVNTRIHFAIGCFGDADTTGDELVGFGAGLKTLFDELEPVITFEPIQPKLVVGVDATKSMEDTTLIRPTRVRYLTGTHEIDSYGWLQPAALPWQGALSVAANLGCRVRVRATFLATEPSVEDKREVDRIAEQGRDAQLIAGFRHPDSSGAGREIAELERKLSPPVYVSELAITSERPLSEPEVRSVAAHFAYRDETPPNSAEHNPPTGAAGTTQLLRHPNGHRDALATGVPLYGGLGPRSLLEIVDLAGTAIGLPWPIGARLKGIPARTNVPDPALRAKVDLWDSPARIGIAGGVATGVPEHLRRGHVAITGAAGSGKSTMLAHLIHHDLSVVRPFLLIDPDGELTEYVRGLPSKLRLRCLIIDPSDRSRHHLSFTPRLGPARGNQARVLRLAALSADAMVRLGPHGIRDDPRFQSLCTAAFELQGATGADVTELIEMIAEPDRLRGTLDEVTLSKESARQLSGVADRAPGYQDYAFSLVALLERIGARTWQVGPRSTSQGTEFREQHPLRTVGRTEPQ